MSTPKKLRAAMAAVAAMYFIVTFFGSLTPGDPTTYTEHNSKSLEKQRKQEQHVNWKQHAVDIQTNNINRLPEMATVRQQLSFQFPYEPRKGFQKNIWQTWKVGVEDGTFPDKYKKYQNEWAEKNPGYHHYVITDEQCDLMINDLFGSVPDVKEAWNSMPKSILKADFFRYLILYARGGVYSDIDTTALKPIDTWLSANATVFDQENTAGLVVGIEADPDRPDWAEWYARRIQFCQWTIQAKKGHPQLRELIAAITEITLNRKKKGQLRKVLGKDEGGDIMNWTGPGIWTDSVFEYLNNLAQPQMNRDEGKVETIVDWQLFTGLTKPRIVEDVMVLPITSFSPDVGQMGARSSNHELAYAKHMFSGSWKND
ncbi:hypothetical protein FT663_04159 [Candidozyma haemuli var. vulneris]|uniref:Initiation-specific alpha-1,6-mannosyltransferase n=1 Tax=Candidozyma haemuli TaxID=45357 RepID=A0A2V1AXS2_9ASCO|nr:hypothetical protein CXQ85_002611 [[Candida] haemuloni]KAF3986920.1 hypothetical protein FT662_04283 [[Candida] haemuloni var. vulneris]KAF3988142.1 hypothetical protein FT663_04159 [[Candida] haemuloni var. vulneris]PVH22887.1 hypothetical protein CXQ85_002611 [[Candida] haemuloni]